MNAVPSRAERFASRAFDESLDLVSTSSHGRLQLISGRFSECQTSIVNRVLDEGGDGGGHGQFIAEQEKFKPSRQWIIRSRRRKDRWHLH